MPFIDAREQLLGGLIQYLTTALAGLVPADAIRPGWLNADLVNQVQTGVLNPLVIVHLGKEKPAAANQRPGTASSPRSVTVAGSVATSVVETDRLVTPVTILCLASGERGRALAGNVIAQVHGALGLVTLVALPDDPTAATSTYAYGIVASVFAAGGDEDARGAERLLWRSDAYYTALAGRWLIRTDPAVTHVAETLNAQIVPLLP